MPGRLEAAKGVGNGSRHASARTSGRPPVTSWSTRISSRTFRQMASWAFRSVRRTDVAPISPSWPSAVYCSRSCSMRAGPCSTVTGLPCSLGPAFRAQLIAVPPTALSPVSDPHTLTSL